MSSKVVAQLLADLGVAKSQSRPYVSNDNPFSESHFKTMKYRPESPPRFGSLPDARNFCVIFFGWYNKEHRHSGIGLMTPESVHYEEADEIRQLRSWVLEQAFRAHPERFVGGQPIPPAIPKALWLNPPVERDKES